MGGENVVWREFVGGDVRVGVASRACSRGGFDRVIRGGRLLIFAVASSRTRRH